MNYFQLIALIFLGSYLIYQLIKLKKLPLLSVLYNLRTLIFFMAALIIIIDPDIASKLASIVGIGRGADLVIYVSILILLFKLYTQSRKIDLLEKKIDELIRKMAIKNYEHKKQ